VCVDKVINYLSIYEEKTVKLLNVLVISNFCSVLYLAVDQVGLGP